MGESEAAPEIVRRDLKFGRQAPPPRWWLAGDPGATAFYNALSATFPLGERFFMDSVRHYRARAPEPLQRQIGDFLFQEATHTREHVVFNSQAEAAGYDIAPLEARTRRVLNWARKRPPIARLAATAALEHFTAVLAQTLLADPAHLDGAAPDAARLWRWHAIEEIEHKAVAYDAFMHVARRMPAAGRWALRSAAMAAAAVLFHYVIMRNTADLLAQDRQNGVRAWAKLLGQLYGKPGAMRRLSVAAFAYCRPGFHPWDEDDRALLNAAQAAL